MAEEVECECWELNNPTDKADNSSLDIRPNQWLPLATKQGCAKLEWHIAVSTVPTQAAIPEEGG